MTRRPALRTLAVALVACGVSAAFAASTLAQGPTPAPSPETLDGPSAAIDSLNGLSIARDGTGGLVYLKTIGGVQHVFVSPLVGGSFGPPQQVDAALPAGSQDPVIAAGNGGVLLVAFINEGSLYVADRLGPSGPFAAAQLLAVGAGSPAIQMTNFGKAYIAFTLADGAGDDVRAAYYDNGQWALEPTPLNVVPADDAGTGSGQPAVAAAGDGVAIVAWGENGHVYTRRVWGTSASVVYEQADVPTFHGYGEVSAGDPSVASGGDSSYGDVVFSEELNEGSQTQTLVLMNRLQGSVYDGVTEVDGLSEPGPAGATQPGITETEYGHGLITSAQNPANELWAAVLGNNGIVTNVERIDSLPNASLPDGTFGVDGLYSGFIAWQHDPGALGQPEIRARYWSTSGLGPELVLSPPTLGPTDAGEGLFTAGDIAGDAAVAWLQGTGASTVLEVEQLYQPPGGFGPPSSFSYARTVQPVLAWSAANELWGPTLYTVALDGARIGQTTSTQIVPPAGLSQGRHIWQVVATNPAGLTSTAASATVFVDTIPPVVSYTLSGTKRVGSLLHVYVSYNDTPPGLPAADGSGVASVSVNWGDGSIYQIRHGKFHIYRRPGLYLLRVTVTDRAGNVTKLSHWLRIKPKPKPSPSQNTSSTVRWSDGWSSERRPTLGGRPGAGRLAPSPTLRRLPRLSSGSVADAGGRLARADVAHDLPRPGTGDHAVRHEARCDPGGATIDRVVGADEVEAGVEHRGPNADHRDVQLPRERRLDAVVDGGEARAAGIHAVVTADCRDRVGQLVEQVDRVARDGLLGARARDPARGEWDRDREQRGRHHDRHEPGRAHGASAPQSSEPRGRELADPRHADATEYADERGCRQEEAFEAGVVVEHHHDDLGDPRAGGNGDPDHHPIPPDERDHDRDDRGDHDRGDLEVPGAADRGQLGMGAELAVVLLCVDRRQQRLARADPRRHEPEERLRGETEDDQDPESRFLEPQPDPVHDQERPPLGADQAADDADRERLPAAAVEEAVDRPHGSGDQHRLGCAPEHVVPPVLREHDAEHRGDAGDGAEHPQLRAAHRGGGAAGHEPVRQAPRTDESEQAAGAGRDDPQRRRRAAEQRIHGREHHRQGLP